MVEDIAVVAHSSLTAVALLPSFWDVVVMHLRSLRTAQCDALPSGAAEEGVGHRDAATESDDHRGIL